MPSSKDPKSAVNPGPGKLPAGVVPAGALLFPPGGGTDAALQAHITNPLDAHMASAIGVNPYDSVGNPILSSVGGVVDGESVLDFIDQFKDLLPATPNYLGFNLTTGVNTGIPSWGALNANGVGGGTSLTGGYALGSTTTPSHFIVPTGSASFGLGGTIFPADRGVVALYSNTDGNFFNAGATTLVAAIALGDPPGPSGIPSAAFNEALRTGQQLNYTPTSVGVDIITLTYRLPYLKSYASYPGAPYTAYDTNFYRFQLATFAVAAQSIAAGGAQNWLLVHWREGFATNLAAIQPANLTLATLVAANAYSAVPTGGNFDDNTQPSYNINRHHVFRDTASATAPSLAGFATSAANSPSTVTYSGVPFVNQTTLQFNVDITANNLFNNSFDTGSVDNPPDVPTQFHSAFDPMIVHFADFGGGAQILPYDVLNPSGSPTPKYSISNAPQTADVAEYLNTALGIVSPASAYTPNNAVGYSTLTVDLHKVFTQSLGNPNSAQKYLYNTFPASGGVSGSSTSTFEGFVDELHRYVSLHSPVNTDRIVPIGGSIYVSATSLAVDTDSSQIATNNLVYPQEDFSTAAFYPTGPNYSGLPGSDGANHFRRHLRAFDTGIPRNTGTLRIRFLPGHGNTASFTQNAAYNGTESTGHITGGMIIQVKVPGSTGWLDIGRALGDPGLSTLDFYGCSTGVTVSGSDILVTFNTTSFTANNTFGEFPLFVRVTLLNNAAGQAIRLDELAWSP